LPGLNSGGAAADVPPSSEISVTETITETEIIYMTLTETETETMKFVETEII